MNNTQLAEKFAQGATTGKASNMFIDGDTIYSYGYHFPIAKRTKFGYLFNSNSYSNSTAKHQGHVQNAIDGVVIKTPECKPELFESYAKNELRYFTAKLAKARTTKEVWQRSIDQMNVQIAQFNQQIKFKKGN